MSETRMMLLDRLRRGAKTLRFFHVDEPCDWDAVTKDDAVLHIPKEWLDLPLIGPAHAPVVLDGVTVEELARLLDDSVSREAEKGLFVEDTFVPAVRAILSRIGIAIPEGYGIVTPHGDAFAIVTDVKVRNTHGVAFLPPRKEEE